MKHDHMPVPPNASLQMVAGNEIRISCQMGVTMHDLDLISFDVLLVAH